MEELYKNYKTMTDEEKIKYSPTLDEIFGKREYEVGFFLKIPVETMGLLEVKEVKGSSVPQYGGTVKLHNLTWGQSVFGIEDTLQPIEEYIKELKQSTVYIDALVSLKDWRTRVDIAEGIDTKDEILDYLKEDRDMMVRKGIAANHRTPLKTLDYLKDDNHVAVRLELIANPRAPSSVIDFMHHDNNPHIVEALKNRENVGKKAFDLDLSCMKDWNENKEGYFNDASLPDEVRKSLAQIKYVEETHGLDVVKVEDHDILYGFNDDRISEDNPYYGKPLYTFTANDEEGVVLVSAKVPSLSFLAEDFRLKADHLNDSLAQDKDANIKKEKMQEVKPTSPAMKP